MFGFLAVLFFLSGASALVYQLLWLRLLGLVFGVTVHAASTVWAAFMAGLALGSILAGVAGDRVRRPLAWFGVTEILTGLTAVLTPAAIAALQSTFVSLAPSLPHMGAASVAPRFAMAFAVLIVPTVLMGATMPLVVRSSAFSGSLLGSRAGALYAANTAGAIAGTLAAGLFLIPQLGLRTSFTIAAAVNVLVGAAALVMARKGTSFAVDERLPPPDLVRGTAGSENDGTAGQRTLVLIVFAISGFVSLALEVVWFRVITMFLRPTVYGYAFMLATLLFGIAAGSALATPLMRKRFDRLLALALLEGALAVASLLSFTALGWIPGSMQLLEPALRPVLGPYLAYQAVVCARCHPSHGLAAWHRFSDWAERVAGRRDVVCVERGAANRRVLLTEPCGRDRRIARDWLLSAPTPRQPGQPVALGDTEPDRALALLWRSGVPRGDQAGYRIGCAALCALTASPCPIPSTSSCASATRTIASSGGAKPCKRPSAFTRTPAGMLTLNVNGIHQASSAGSTPFVHRRIGNLPMAVHPDPRTALVIGLGGGATAGAVSRHTGVSVDVVELSREVVMAADRFFRTINGSLIHRPHVRVMVDDGRNYLLLTNQRYDVITADVILPIHAGAGNLYSKEYFTLVRRALKPGGMAVQWVAGTDAEYKLIMRTFLSVFPETTLWADGSLMIGGLEPLRLRRKDLEWKLQVPARRQMLAELGVTNFEKLRALYRAGPDELRRYVGSGPVLTDDRPLVEYFLSLPRDRQVDLSSLTGDVDRYVDDGPSAR